MVEMQDLLEGQGNTVRTYGGAFDEGNMFPNMSIFRGPKNTLLFGSHPFTDPRVLSGKTHGYDLFREYNDTYREEPFYGTYAFLNYPVLIVRDLDLAKRILCKDQEHFQDRQFFRTRFTAGKSETDRGDAYMMSTQRQVPQNKLPEFSTVNWTHMRTKEG